MTTKIYGTSDDLIEFEGDIYDEIGAYKAQDKGYFYQMAQCSNARIPRLRG